MIEEKTHRKSEPLQPAIPTLSPLCPLSLGPQLSVTGKKGISHVAKLGRPHALCLVLESKQSLVIDKLLLCLCLLATVYLCISNLMWIYVVLTLGQFSF